MLELGISDPRAPLFLRVIDIMYFSYALMISSLFFVLPIYQSYKLLISVCVGRIGVGGYH